MTISILTGDALDQLRALPDASVHCCVTSPPYYGLRDYGMVGQIGLEDTPEAFIGRLVEVFREVRRTLRDDGTCWLNIGDSYCSTDKWGGGGNVGKNTVADDGTVPAWAVRKKRPHLPDIKPKDLIGIPWMLAFALRADGWYLRQDIIWHKPNPMPESVTDRCTKSHEYVFLLSKSSRYHYDAGAISEPATFAGKDITLGDKSFSKGQAAGAGVAKSGNALSDSYTVPDTRNKRSVWSITTQPYSEAHFATMAPELADTCIKAGCPKDGTVIDPFGGAGTTGLCADRLGRNAILIELNPAYVEIARKRLSDDAGMFAEVAA